MAAQSSQALIVAATAAMFGKEKLEARLLSLCMNAGVSDALMDKMGESGLVSVARFVNIVTSKEKLQAMFMQAPFDLSGADFLTKSELGKITSVYVAAMTTSECQVKADAERVLQNLPPTTNTLDMDSQENLPQAVTQDRSFESAGTFQAVFREEDSRGGDVLRC